MNPQNSKKMVKKKLQHTQDENEDKESGKNVALESTPVAKKTCVDGIVCLVHYSPLTTILREKQQK